MLATFSYLRATSIAGAAQAAARPGAHILAGGTDLLGCLRDGVFPAERLVSLKNLESLKGIRPRPTRGLRIGALTTLTEIAGDRRIRQDFPVLAQAAASVGTPQLRNQGTLGGNLCQRPRCWYYRGDFQCRRKGGNTCFAEAGENQQHAILGGHDCYIVHPSDTAVALVALDARFRIAGPQGTRLVPATSFFVLPQVSILKENVLAPGEFITEILLDPLPAGARTLYRKVRERAAFDFALASAAIVLVKDQDKVASARIVFGGIAPIPWRAKEAEQALAGKLLTTATVSAAAEAALKDAVPLAENGYKLPLVRGLLREVLLG